MIASAKARLSGTRAAAYSLAVAALLALSAFTAAPALAAPPAHFGGPEGNGAGQFDEPSGIAVRQSSGDIYLSDRNNSRVEKFGPEGEFLLAWGWGVRNGTAEPQTCGPQASPPSAHCFPGLEGTGAGEFEGTAEGIAVDNDLASSSHGDVYVVDREDNRVEKFGPDGNFLLMLGGGVDQGPNHPGNLCTAAFLVEGDVCGAGAEEGTGAGEFSHLRGRAVAVGPGGRLFVADLERVQRFSSEGAPEAQFSIPGAGRIENLAVDSAGDLYLQSELSGVRKYDPSGTELGEPRDAAGRPGPLAIGASDRLFLADRESGHVLAFDPSGDQLSSTYEPGEAKALAYGEIAAGLYVLHPEFVHFLVPATPGVPYVVGQSATEIATTSASLNATLNPEGGAETEYHFEYGTEAGVYPESTPETPLPLNEIQSLTLVAEGGAFSLSYEGEPSAEVPFNATAAELQAALEAIPAIGAGNVEVTGPPGGPYAIEFTGALAERDVAELSPEAANLTGEDPSATIATTSPGHSAFEDREASAPLTNLQPRTTYHFRVVATNAAHETTEGPDQEFTTLPPVSIDATSASLISATTATLEAELNPHGLATTYHFEYDTTPYTEGGPAHGTAVPIPDGEAGSGEVDVARSALLQGLQAATTYHYRVVAENALGTVEGPDRSFTTQGAAPSLLPDGRGWEQVSPPDKHGVSLEAIANEGADIQAAADGSALAYVATGPIEARPPGNRSFVNSQQLARRQASGWAGTDVSTPHEAVAGIEPGSFSEYQLFSSDLSLGAVEPQGLLTPLSPRTSERTPYLRGPGGDYTPLVSGCPAEPKPCPPAVAEHANVPQGVEFGGQETAIPGVFSGGVGFVTATPDLSHLLLQSPQPLTPDFPEGFEATFLPDVFEWSQGALELVSILPDGHPATVDGGSATVGNNNNLVRHALSSDGSRLVFTTTLGGTGHLYLRDTARGETVQLDAVQGGAGGASEVLFQGASADGSKVFFTDWKQLTPDATASAGHPDLYMCEVGLGAGSLACDLKDLSIPLTSGERAGVLGAMLGAGESGERVYFVAKGDLTGSEANQHGEAAQGGQPNLYSYDTATETTKLIAVLSSGDFQDWNAGGLHTDLGELTARVSPDGRWLAFMSQRPLTGYDNRDARSGQRDQEVYLYDARSEKLLCASCNPTGARPAGVFDSGEFPGLLVDRPLLWGDQWLAGSIPGWTKVDIGHSLYQSRYLSNSGRLFFNAADALVPQDSNGKEDVYQYEPPGVGGCTQSSPGFGRASGGCVDLISSGTSGEESAFLDASETGNDVFFLTAAGLTPGDEDGALDVYDAHVCSAELPCPPPPPPAPPACEGDACQQPATPPAHPTPGTALLNGPGNLLQCPKGKVKRHGKCVARKHHKAKHKKKAHGKKSHRRTAGHNRGGHK